MNKRGREVQDGFELLDDGSSGSEHEHFSMTTLSLALSNDSERKSRERHRTSPKKASNDQCCSLPVALLFLLVVVVSACLAILAVYVYSLHNNLEQLKNKIQILESDVSKKSDPVQLHQPQGLMQLTKRQDSIEASLADLKDHDITTIKLNVTKIFNSIVALNATIEKVKDTQPAVENPKVDYSMISKNMADLGSDLQSVKDQQKQISSQVNNIQVIDELLVDIGNLNYTMLSHFHEQMLTIQRLQNRTNSLELRVDLKDVKPENSAVIANIEKLVQDAIHSSLEELQNLTQPISKDVNSGPGLEMMVNSLQVQIDRINETISYIKDEIDEERSRKPDFVAPASGIDDHFLDYTQFKNSTTEKIKTLKDNFELLSNEMRDVEDTLKTLTEKAGDLITNIGDTDTDTDLKETATLQPEGPLHLQGVLSVKDLNGFHLWDVNEDGKLDADELKQAFPLDVKDDNPIQMFDVDKDEKLSEDELIAALGFTADAQLRQRRSRRV